MNDTQVEIVVMFKKLDSVRAEEVVGVFCSVEKAENYLCSLACGYPDIDITSRFFYKKYIINYLLDTFTKFIKCVDCGKIIHHITGEEDHNAIKSCIECKERKNSEGYVYICNPCFAYRLNQREDEDE